MKVWDGAAQPEPAAPKREARRRVGWTRRTGWCPADPEERENNVS